ncbi:hypothetical protein ABGB21_19395 [Plantactinospora sp. B24E8]
MAGRPELWTDDLRRTSRERTYVDVHTSDHLGVWAISWMADVHDTGYHDHAASRGAVVMVEGGDPARATAARRRAGGHRGPLR